MCAPRFSNNKIEKELVMFVVQTSVCLFVGGLPYFFSRGGFLERIQLLFCHKINKVQSARNMGVSLFKGTQNCDFLFVSLQSQKQRLGDTPHIPYREDPPLFPTQNCFFCPQQEVGSWQRMPTNRCCPFYSGNVALGQIS